MVFLQALDILASENGLQSLEYLSARQGTPGKSASTDKTESLHENQPNEYGMGLKLKSI